MTQDCGYREFKAPITVGFVLSGQHTNLYAVNQGDLTLFIRKYTHTLDQNATRFLIRLPGGREAGTG
jgi:hypothetical protein